MKEVTKHGRTLLFVSHSMASIQRFCNRCVWMDAGQIRAVGSVIDVTERYISATLNLQSSYAAIGPDMEPNEENYKTDEKTDGSTQTQIDTETSPSLTPVSDELQPLDKEAFESAPIALEKPATLRRAYVIDRTSKKILCATVNQAVGVVIHFDIGKSGIYVPGIALHGPDGELLFWSVPSSLNTEDHYKKPGHYQAIVWIPDNLLNVGTYEVTITLVDPSQSPFERIFHIEKALQFQAIESKASEPSSRGIMPRDFPGGLRPKLTWDIDLRDEISTK